MDPDPQLVEEFFNTARSGILQKILLLSLINWLHLHERFFHICLSWGKDPTEFSELIEIKTPGLNSRHRTHPYFDLNCLIDFGCVPNPVRLRYVWPWSNFG